MKMTLNSNRIQQTTAAVVLAAACLAALPATARAYDDNDRHAAGRGLEGTWSFQVTLRDCSSGAPLGVPFYSLLTFNEGGTMTETTANAMFYPAERGPGHGGVVARERRRIRRCQRSPLSGKIPRPDHRQWRPHPGTDHPAEHPDGQQPEYLPDDLSIGRVLQTGWHPHPQRLRDRAGELVSRLIRNPGRHRHGPEQPRPGALAGYCCSEDADSALLSWRQAHATLTNSGPGKPAPFSLMQLPRIFAASTPVPLSTAQVGHPRRS